MAASERATSSWQSQAAELNNIAGKTVRMHAHESRFRAFQFAANQRDVLVVIHVAGVGNHSEIAESAWAKQFRLRGERSVHAACDSESVPRP